MLSRDKNSFSRFLKLEKYYRQNDFFFTFDSIVNENKNFFNTDEQAITCKIIKGGIVKDGKLIQLLDSLVPLPQISEKDIAHMKWASHLECDFLIMNHVRSEKVLYTIKSRFKEMSMRIICILFKLINTQ